ncbi:MAG: methylmalonyl-CoA mutase family protein [Caldisericota bacterium]|nr:methylmalonyl-CoA mutase family protein [Caldisericota bacterium]
MDEKERLAQIRSAGAAWQEKADKVSVGKTCKAYADCATVSGIDVKLLYTPEDVGEMDYMRDLGFPGEYPFTRGYQPTMYRGRLWTMRQYAGFATVEESNRRYKYLLGQGQTGLSIAFDLPTQLGLDADHPLADGEVGKVGVSVSSLADMEVLFDGIPLDQVSTSMTINAPAAVLLAMYIAVARRNGIGADKLNGTIQNDILKEYSARGTYIFPPTPSMRIINDIFAYCSKEVPNWNTISISGYHMREAGCTAVQEVAFTLADGIAYVDAAIKAGLNVDDFAQRLSFFFNAHNNLLEEVAKFRAARRMWARIMKERFQAQNPKSLMLRFHTQTAGSTLTSQQVDNNVVRVTLQALAAVLGGTQSLHTNSRDEALSLPTEESVRIALRTQQILGYESGVADTVDPLAGSYYVESLTNRIEKEAWKYIQKIDDLGGAVKAVENGYVQREIQNSAYAYQMSVESGERVVVGANKFQLLGKPLKNVTRIDSSLSSQRRAELEALKARRDNARVEHVLAGVKAAAGGTENLMPAIIGAVDAYATLGEICGVLRSVYGEYRPDASF